MVAAEAAAAGSPPLVARHSGLAEIAEGLEQEYPPHLRHLAGFATGDAAELGEKLRELLALPDADRAGDPRGRAERDRHAAGAGPASPAACWNRSTTLPRMGDEQRLGVRGAPRARRGEGFDEGTDFTVAVEEEFALLDPATLDLVNRFEEVQAAAQGTPLEPNLVGELIASEVEVKTGRCETFADVPAAMAERRAQLQALVEPLGLALGATGTHPWAPLAGAADHRHAALPPQRRAAPLRRLAQQHASACTSTSASAAPTARSRSRTGCATSCPSCSRSRRARRSSRTSTPGLHSARTQIFTRFFPRCGVPDAFASWQEYEDYVRFLYETGSITEHTQLWWSVRPHLAFPTVEIRICDAQPDLAEAQALAAFATSLAARIARAHDEGEPLADQPHRLIEENMWRAIRYGLSGELIDLERGDVLPARARLERLLEWVAPGRRGDRRRAVPRDPGAQRRRAADRALRGGGDAGGDLRRAGRGPGSWLTTSASPRTSCSRRSGSCRSRICSCRRSRPSPRSPTTGSPRSTATSSRRGSRSRRCARSCPVLAGVAPAGARARLRAGDGEPPARLRRRGRARLLNRGTASTLVIHNPPRRGPSALTL